MRAIVNFANGSYIKGQFRLQESVKEYADVPLYNDCAEIGSPEHQKNPYAFKLYAIQDALNKGYTQILYVDASVWAIKDVTPLFDIIEKEGYLMQNSGWTVGRWSNENALRYFGITRDEAEGMTMYGDAGLLGLNFENEVAREFFDQWMTACQDGAFYGSWDNHRHDMTCGSVIANQLGMEYKEGILAYAGPHDEVPESVILKAQGMI